MSYILDALRKLEREQKGESRVGETSLEPVEPAPRRRLTWPLIGGAALLVNVVLIALLLWPGRPAKPSVAKATAPAPTAAATAPPPAAPIAPPPPPAGSAAPSTPPQPAAAPPVAAAPPARGLADDVTPGAPAAVPPPAAVPKAADPPAPAGSLRTARTPEPPPSLHAGAIARPSAPAVSAAPARKPAAAPPRDAVGAAPERRAPAAALSTGIPAGAPPLRLEVLVYSERAADRFVFINGRKFIEGQPVDEGVVLERIQSDSAVLSYQGRRFLLRE